MFSPFPVVPHHTTLITRNPNDFSHREEGDLWAELLLETARVNYSSSGTLLCHTRWLGLAVSHQKGHPSHLGLAGIRAETPTSPCTRGRKHQISTKQAIIFDLSVRETAHPCSPFTTLGLLQNKQENHTEPFLQPHTQSPPRSFISDSRSCHSARAASEDHRHRGRGC